MTENQRQYMTKKLMLLEKFLIANCKQLVYSNTTEEALNYHYSLTMVVNTLIQRLIHTLLQEWTLCALNSKEIPLENEKYLDYNYFALLMKENFNEQDDLECRKITINLNDNLILTGKSLNISEQTLKKHVFCFHELEALIHVINRYSTVVTVMGTLIINKKTIAENSEIFQLIPANIANELINILKDFTKS